MATLYVQEQGVMVRKKDNQIVVTKSGQVLQEAPLGKIDQVIPMGRGVQMSTALIMELSARGIPVLLTNQRGSRYYGSWVAWPSRFGDLRIQQMLRVNDPAWTLEVARGIVQAKLINQRALLATTGWAGAAAAMTQIDAALTSLAGATTIDMVRGYEGAAAAAYFGAWRTVYAANWGFHGRSFYPPPDPINALLSFGYTLALHDVLTAVQFTGLDLYLGVFHAVEQGRPSLALDLMEEFRPLLVDQAVLDLLHSASITKAQFERPPQPPDAVYLNAKGRALIIERYETRIQQLYRLPSNEETPLRRVILLQARALARLIRGEQSQYIGYTR
jgi:CRISPR-associated protein Cas1